MNENFLKGMNVSMNLFPQDRDIAVHLPSYSDEDAFKKDLEAVGKDMWFAMKSVEQCEL